MLPALLKMSHSLCYDDILLERSTRSGKTINRKDWTTSTQTYRIVMWWFEACRADAKLCFIARTYKKPEMCLTGTVKLAFQLGSEAQKDLNKRSRNQTFGEAVNSTFLTSRWRSADSMQYKKLEMTKLREVDDFWQWNVGCSWRNVQVTFGMLASIGRRSSDFSTVCNVVYHDVSNQ